MVRDVFVNTIKWERIKLLGNDRTGVPITNGRRMNAMVNAKKHLGWFGSRHGPYPKKDFWAGLDADTRAAMWAYYLNMTLAAQSDSYALDSECLWYMVLHGDSFIGVGSVYLHEIDLSVPPPKVPHPIQQTVPN